MEGEGGSVFALDGDSEDGMEGVVVRLPNGGKRWRLGGGTDRDEWARLARAQTVSGARDATEQSGAPVDPHVEEDDDKRAGSGRDRHGVHRAVEDDQPVG